MIAAVGDGSGGSGPAPAAPPAPAPTPAPPAPAPTPAPPAPAPSSSSGESLAAAEQAVRALVAQGMSGAAALAAHPLPAGTSTADALAFLGSLPATTYAIDSTQGTPTAPPSNPPGTSVDVPDGGSVDRTTLSAYKPPGLVAQWRDLVDVLKIKAPARRATIATMFDSPKEFWK